MFMYKSLSDNEDIVEKKEELYYVILRIQIVNEIIFIIWNVGRFIVNVYYKFQDNRNFFKKKKKENLFFKKGEIKCVKCLIKIIQK